MGTTPSAVALVTNRVANVDKIAAADINGIAQAVKDVDVAAVHTTSDENIDGLKTYSQNPRVLPVPTTLTSNSQLAHKKYVDDKVASVGTGGTSGGAGAAINISAAPYSMSPTATAIFNGAALQQATIDANGRELTASAGDYPIQGCALTDDDVNWNFPGVYFLQPKGGTPAVVIERTPGTPMAVSPTYLTWWGPWQPSGITVSGLLQAIPATGLNRFHGGHVYHISSRDIFPWAWSDQNLTNGDGSSNYAAKSDGLAFQGEQFPLLGIGMVVSSLANGGPLESMMVQGATSGASGLVQSRLVGNSGGGITATQSHITFTSVTGDFVDGENLVRITGGNPTYPSGTIATVGQTVGVVTGLPVLLTTDLFLLQYGRTTAAQATAAGTNSPTPVRTDNTVQLREVNTNPICRIKGLGIDIVGARDDPDTYVDSTQRMDSVQLRGVYAAEVEWRVRNSWTRALAVWSSYMGRFTGFFDQGPNHAILTQSAFSYGIELKSGSKGCRVTIMGHTMRHIFTTNPNERTWALANDYSGGKWTQWDYGTPIRTTVYGGTLEAAFGPAMDTHPGDYYTTFENLRIYGGGSGGRYNTDNNSAFSSRGFGTKWKNVESDASVVGFNIGSVEHDAGFNYRNVLDSCHVTGALAQCIYTPAAIMPGQCTIEVVGGSFSHRVNYPKDAAGTVEATNNKYGLQVGIQIGDGVNLEVSGDAKFRKFGAAWLRSLGSGTVTVYSAIVDHTECPSSGLAGMRMEPGTGVTATVKIFEMKVNGNPTSLLRTMSGTVNYYLGDIQWLGTGTPPSKHLLSGGSATVNDIAPITNAGGGGGTAHSTAVAPSVAVGANATGATVTLTSGSTDVSGEVQIVMSTTAGTANGPVATVTFGTAFTADVFPVVSGVLNAVNRSAGVWSHSTTSFAIAAGNALAASTTYKFTYYVPGV